MTDLLFLSQRIPYPPNKGDKIRSWHILQHLARRHRVHLACFIDDPADWTYTDSVRAVCTGETLFVKLDPTRAKLRSLRGLLSGDPLTRYYFESPTLRAWVKDRIAADKPDSAFVFSSAMAPYLTEQGGCRRNAASSTWSISIRTNGANTPRGPSRPGGKSMAARAAPC